MFPARSAIVGVIAVCLHGYSSASGQQMSPRFAISGTVVEHGSGRPLRNVMMIISPVDRRDQGISYVTASDGRFTFPNLAAGKYSLVAEGRGFLPQAFHEQDGFSTAIAVGPGLDSEHIIFPLKATGSLLGTVLDEEGDPVRSAQVWLFRKGILSGKHEIAFGGVQNTDLSGEFTFSHLLPGTYFVGVQAHPWYAQNSPPQTQTATESEQPSSLSNLDVAYPVTYYGDTTEASSASPITVAEGSSAKIQVTLRAVPAVHVELSGVDAKPNGGFNATAFAVGPGGYPITVAAGTGPIMNNHQVITGLAPGHYVVSSQEWSSGKVQSYGSKPLDVNGNMSLDAAAFSEATLSGHIAMDGGELPAGLVVILAASGGNGYGEQAPVGQDGTFTVKNSTVPLGPYEIQLRGAGGIYLKSIEAKGAKVSGNEIDTSAGTAVELALLAAKGTTRIDGTALRDDKPFAGAMVLLIPKDQKRADFIGRDQSDSDGTFTLSDVPPGQYTVIAMDDGHDFAYQEPSVIAPYLAGGIALTVPLPDDSPVKVNVSTRRQ